LINLLLNGAKVQSDLPLHSAVGSYSQSKLLVLPI